MSRALVAGWMLSLVACESAAVVRGRDAAPDALVADTGPEADAATGDAGTDTGVTLGGPEAPVMPDPPAPHARPTERSIEWLAGTSAAELASAEPDIAEPVKPVLPCPAGWSAMSADDDFDVPSICEPWAADGPGGCMPGQAWFPGRSACEPVGTPCPTTGSWASDLPATGTPIVYVLPGAAGGAGTFALPYGTLAEALAAAPAGAIVALAAGTYPRTTISRALTLWGTCTRDVVFEATASQSAALEVTVPGVVLRNVSARGGQAALRVTSPGAVDVGGLEASDSDSPVLVDGGTLRGMRLVARGATGSVSSQHNGLFARRRDSAPATVELDTVLVRDAESRGVTADGAGTSITLTRAAISRAGADGLYASGGASITTRETLLERSTNTGFGCTGSGSRVTLEDTLVRDVQSRAAGDGGFALLVRDDCAASVTGSAIVRARGTAVAVGGGTASLDADSVVVLDTQTHTSDGRGWAVELLTGAQLSRVLIARAFGRGISVAGTGMVELADVIVHDVAPTSSDDGIGIRLESGMSTLERVAVERATGVGLLLVQSHRSVGSDLRIAETAIGAERGFGIVAEGGAHAEIARVVLEANGDASALVRPSDDGIGGTLEMSGVAIRPAVGGTVDAVGLLATAGSIVANDLVVHASTGSAITARGADAGMSITGAVIADTTSRGDQSGYALLVSEGASVTLTSASLLRNGNEVVRAQGATSSMSLLDVIVRTEAGARASARGVVVTESSADIERLFLDGPFALALDVRERATCVVSNLATLGAYAGVQARDGSDLTLHRASLDRTLTTALRAHGAGTHVTADDVRITGDDAAAEGAVGALASDGGELSLARVAIEGAFGLGAGSLDRGSALVLRDALVTGTRASTEPAVGIAVLDGDLDALTFVVAGTDGVGVAIADASGDVVLGSGEIHDNGVGLASMLDADELALLFASVWFHDNDTVLDGAPRTDPRVPAAVDP